MEIREIYLKIRPEDIAYIKFIVESYEGVGIVRTVERRQATIVLLVVDDFCDVARRILSSVAKDIPLTEISRPADIADDWLMRELAGEPGPRRS